MREWYCIYTKRNQEDVVCAKLNELPGVEHFNPKMKRKKLIRRRLTEVVEELFPCYVFAKIDPLEHYLRIKYVRGVKRFVGNASGEPYTVDEPVIRVLKSMVRKDGFVFVEQQKFRLGDNVTISEGPFHGFTGVLADLKPKDRVMILLNTLQYQAKVEVPREFLQKV